MLVKASLGTAIITKYTMCETLTKMHCFKCLFKICATKGIFNYNALQLRKNLTTVNIMFLLFQMDNGATGALLAVVPSVELGLSFGPDSAIVQLLLMEGQTALEKTPIPLLATMGNVMVK
jgi:hypothetical protein